MRERRQKILADPESYRQAQIEKDLPTNYDELPDDEQQEILEKLEGLVTPGHPLFECVREETWRQTEQQLQRGAVFFDIYSEQPYRLDVFSAAIHDGRGNVLHRRLFVVQTDLDGSISIRQPTIFLDLVPATGDVDLPDDTALPARD
jgi:hypothetical protein